MNEQYLIIIVVAVIILLILKVTKENSDIDNISDTDKKLSDIDKDLYNYFYYDILTIINRFNLDIQLAQVLAVIKTESNSLFKTKANNEIIGDDGNSIGFMQVSKYALKDVNNYYNLSYKFNDLYNYYENLVVGCLYLNLCYKSALNSNSRNAIWLSFKKYNGGIDETDNSINKSAINYANKTYNYYLEFSKQ